VEEKEKKEKLKHTKEKRGYAPSGTRKEKDK